MTRCPVCSDVLLRHISSGRSYWLCRSCRLEIAGQPSGQAMNALKNRSHFLPYELMTEPERSAHSLSKATQ